MRCISAALSGGGLRRCLAAFLDPFGERVNVESGAGQQPQQRAYGVEHLALGRRS